MSLINTERRGEIRQAKEKIEGDIELHFSFTGCYTALAGKSSFNCRELVLYCLELKNAPIRDCWKNRDR